MNKDQWQQIEKIFYAAMELPRDERDDFVGQACASDEELRREVQALLAANRDAASFLDSPVAMPPRSGTLSPTLVMPQAILNSTSAAESGIHVGHYRLLREIGRGGMGVVWLAERADGQFRQQVAIKLLHAGAENEEIVRRFRHERQILASLDHPNIARLLDGGTTEDGRPYFVMEHIEGLPIDEYCRQRRDANDSRLRQPRTGAWREADDRQRCLFARRRAVQTADWPQPVSAEGQHLRRVDARRG
jgi:serine/threonine protein kinase